jgi:4'-phosphopantetheinyl transferase
MVLLALTVGGPVGVDVEAAQGDIDLSGLSARVLAPDELAVLEQADEPLRSRLFNQAWTRKEAALKLLGTGFSLDPSRVVVLTDSLSASIPCVCQDLAGRPRRLRVLDLALGEKAAAAVAVERADANVCCFSGASREIPKPVRRTLAESGRV